MLPRLLGVCSLVLLVGSGLLAIPALAVEADPGDPEAQVEPGEEEEELPGIDEIGTQNEVTEQFMPEPPEAPVFTAALLYPLMAIAFLAVVVVLFLYLKWQPRFAEERKEKARR
jgi:hypothetical protein